MWLLFSLGSVFLLAIVNYVDEYLTSKNPVGENSSIQKRMGGLLLVSTLLSVIGICVIKLVVGDVSMSALPMTLALLSAIPTVIMWGSYFYLLNKYPVYQVIPLFQLTAIWLLFIEFFAGGTISTLGLVGVLVLVFGTYILDVGKFQWAIPSKLLVIMMGVSLLWAVNLFMIRIASGMSSGPGAVSFWQCVGVLAVGVILFLFARQYREGFITRIKEQGKLFLGLSVFSESSSQLAYVLSNFAIALAPAAAYASSVNGVQSVFVLALFLLFPQKKTEVNALQIAAIILIAIGVFVLEIS